MILDSRLKQAGWIALLILIIWALPPLIRNNRAAVTLNQQLANATPLAVQSSLGEMTPSQHRANAHALMAQGNFDAAAEAWQAGGVTAFALFERGRHARDRAEVIGWYRMAAHLAPLDDSQWLAVGLACQPNPALDPICDEYLAYNNGNLFRDPTFQFDFLGWLAGDQTRTRYTIEPCPDQDATCLHIVAEAATSGGSAGLNQCHPIVDGNSYYFSALVKVVAPDDTSWRPLYRQARIDDKIRGFWLGEKMGSSDWQLWEHTFIASDYDENRACFHPVLLLDQGEAWMANPVLRVLED